MGISVIFFGLSGTGEDHLVCGLQTILYGIRTKTWLEHPRRNTVFNLREACYAKVINLSEENAFS